MFDLDQSKIQKRFEMYFAERPEEMAKLQAFATHPSFPRIAEEFKSYLCTVGPLILQAADDLQLDYETIVVLLTAKSALRPTDDEIATAKRYVEIARTYLADPSLIFAPPAPPKHPRRGRHGTPDDDAT